MKKYIFSYVHKVVWQINWLFQYKVFEENHLIYTLGFLVSYQVNRKSDACKMSRSILHKSALYHYPQAKDLVMSKYSFTLNIHTWS